MIIRTFQFIFNRINTLSLNLFILLFSVNLLNSPNGVITSPGFPNNYPDNSNVAWLIQVPQGNYIEMNFLSFKTEEYDCLKVYNATSDASTIIEEYCGNDSPKRLISHNHEILLVFTSDYSDNYKGFNIEYKTSSEWFRIRKYQISRNFLQDIFYKSGCIWHKLNYWKTLYTAG